MARYDEKSKEEVAKTMHEYKHEGRFKSRQQGRSETQQSTRA